MLQFVTRQTQFLFLIFFLFWGDDDEIFFVRGKYYIKFENFLKLTKAVGLFNIISLSCWKVISRWILSIFFVIEPKCTRRLQLIWKQKKLVWQSWRVETRKQLVAKLLDSSNSCPPSLLYDIQPLVPGFHVLITFIAFLQTQSRLSDIYFFIIWNNSIIDSALTIINHDYY